MARDVTCSKRKRKGHGIHGEECLKTQPKNERQRKALRDTRSKPAPPSNDQFSLQHFKRRAEDGDIYKNAAASPWTFSFIVSIGVSILLSSTKSLSSAQTHHKPSKRAVPPSSTFPRRPLNPKSSLESTAQHASGSTAARFQRAFSLTRTRCSSRNISQNPLSNSTPPTPRMSKKMTGRIQPCL